MSHNAGGIVEAQTGQLLHALDRVVLQLHCDLPLSNILNTLSVSAEARA